MTESSRIALRLTCAHAAAADAFAALEAGAEGAAEDHAAAVARLDAVLAELRDSVIPKPEAGIAEALSLKNENAACGGRRFLALDQRRIPR